MPPSPRRPSNVVVFGVDHTPADAWNAHFPVERWANHRVQDWSVSAAVELVGSLAPDAVVIDGFRERNGALNLCAGLRHAGPFPILLGVPRLERDEAAAYSAGADDVTQSPLRAASVRLRLEAVWRRAARPRRTAEKTIRLGELRLEPAPGAATFRSRPLDLNASEFALLLAIGRGRGKPVARAELCRELLGCDHETGDRAIDLRVSRLCRKLRQQTGGDGIIATVRGLGYRLAPTIAGT